MSSLLQEQWPSVRPGPAVTTSVPLEISTSASGVSIALFGERRLHSQHDPLREALRAATSLAPEADQLVVFFGAGLGYVVAECLRLYPNDCVWFEPLEPLAKLALARLDVSAELRRGRLRVHTGLPEESTLEEIFRGRSNVGVRFYGHQASYQAHPVYASVQQRCEAYLNRKTVNMATLSRFDREWAHNICKNFAILRRARPIAELFGRYEGQTAVVCGAGPSLAGSLAEISSLRKAVVLIAVDTAVRPLSLAGLDPDFVVTVDPQPVNRHYLEAYTGAARFLVDPTTSYLGLRRLSPERLYYCASPFPLAKLLYQNLPGPPGEIAFGGSVSTNAYDLACKLGCSRILLYGQDFSFTGGLAHVRGAVLEERWNFREHRLARRESHNFRQLSALPVRYLPGILEKQVPTNDKLVIFYNWFRGRVSADLARGLTVINRTAAGAALPVAQILPADLEESGGAKETMPGSAHVSDSSPAMVDLQAFGRTIGTTLTGLDQLLAMARSALAGARALAEAHRAAQQRSPQHWSADAQYQAALAKMDGLDHEVRERLGADDLVGSLMQRSILRITEGYQHQPGSEQPLTPIEQTVEIYLALVGAAERLYLDLQRAQRVIFENGV